jgi:photoactive yellow protein
MLTIDEIAKLSDAELDTLPLGVVRLDRSGTITYYNQAEADLARRTIEGTIGANFFRDVAPCAAVRTFQGRFEEFIEEGSEDESDLFDFLFFFSWGNQEVSISMTRCPGDSNEVMLVVKPLPAG